MSNPGLHLPLGLRPWPRKAKTGPVSLTEGYSFEPLENTTDAYRFSIMISADRLPRLLANLAPRLPEEVFFILEFYQDQPARRHLEEPGPTLYYSPYLPTSEILQTIEPFLPRLIHDGFVGFGLANNREGIEIFYSEEKVLTCFTGNHLRITNLLCGLQIPHKPNLRLPTDIGHDHLSLLCYPRKSLPEPFSTMSEADLDYVRFCDELAELLEMYPVEGDFSFFLSKREQDQIEAHLTQRFEYAEFADEDFGGLLLDWEDFVEECVAGFQGNLQEYRLGLKLRDLIEYVMVTAAPPLGARIREIVAESDRKLRKNLVDRRKRLDSPDHDPPVKSDLFWHQGIVRNQGVPLRRDLIRQGWYKP